MPLSRRTNRMPEPPLVRFLAHIGPQFVEFRAQPTMPLQLVYTTYLYLHVLGRDRGQHRLIHLVQCRPLFF
jgi:hypothetical protein